MKTPVSLVWPAICIALTLIVVTLIYIVGEMARTREAELELLRDFNKELIETNQILGGEVNRLDTELARRHHYPF